MQVVSSSGEVFSYGNLEIVDVNGKPKALSPGGIAGGDLSGTYPNPSVVWANGLPTYDLSYYPLSSNPAGYLTVITALDVTTALGYTPYNATNPAGYITGITSSDVTTALGYTPVTNARNITINGVTQNLSADRTYTVTDANLSTSDITTNDVSITKHGFAPKAPNDTTKFLRGDGTWATTPATPISLTVGTTPITSGTAGRILFEDSSNVLQEDAALFWDNTNKRLGINYPTPATKLDIQGTTTSDGGQLGAELLSASNWTTTGWTGTWAGGFTHTVGNTSVLSNTLAAVIGNYYQIAYTITGRTAGSVTIAFGGATISSATATGASGPKATTTGNLTITPTTDFDGTIVISIKIITAGSALVTMRNSGGTAVNEIRVSNSNTNTFFGISAGSRTTTGLYNTAFGSNSLPNNTTGYNNTAVGQQSMVFNTTGANNTAVGMYALPFNTTGQSNVAIGQGALTQNTTATNNVGVGQNSLTNNATGNNNIAVGQSSLQAHTASTSNTSIGSNSFVNLTSGNLNTALGGQAGRLISGGGNLTTSNNSVFLGYDTRPNADSQTNQIVIGYSAIGLGSNTAVIGNSSTTLFRPYGNVAIGADTAGARLDVRAQGALSTDIAFRVRNSADTVNLFQVNGDGTSSLSGTLSLSNGLSSTGGLLSSQTGTNSGRMLLLNLRNTGGGYLSAVNSSMAIAFTNREAAGLWSNDFIELKVYNNGVGTTTTGYNFYTHNNQSYTTASVLAMSINGQSVGIGVETPNASAILDVTSTTQGFLPPRMTTTQKNAIATPAAGLIVYDTTDNKHYGYNGTAWNALY